VEKKETWLAQKLREEKRPQRWLASEIGCSPSHAHRLTTGQEKPSPKLCREIARVFKMTEQEVMRQVGHLTDLPDNYDKAREHELRDIMRGLSYSNRKTLIEFAQFLFRRGGDDDENGG